MNLVIRDGVLFRQLGDDERVAYGDIYLARGLAASAAISTVGERAGAALKELNDGGHTFATVLRPVRGVDLDVEMIRALRKALA